MNSLKKMDIDLKLIALVKSHEFLYNIESDFYKDILLKENTWNKIGEQLNLSGAKCKKKWKNLRDTYKRVKQRRYALKPWKFKEHMRFLDNVQTFRQNRTIENDQDYIQPSSFSRSQSMENSDTEDDNNIEIKEELIVSDPVTYITSSPPPPPDTKIEIKEEIIVGDSVPCVTSLPISPTKEKIDNCTIEYNTIKNDGGIFYVSLPKNQQKINSYKMDNLMPNVALPPKLQKVNSYSKCTTLGNATQSAAKEPILKKMDNCFQSNTLRRGLQIVAVASVPQIPPQKEKTVENCFQPSTFESLVPSVTKHTVLQKQEKGKYFQSTSLGVNVATDSTPQRQQNVESSTLKGLQIVAIGSVSQTPSQKKPIVDSSFQSGTVTNANKIIVEDSNDSSEDFQFSPVSYATSTPPPSSTLPLPKQENPDMDVLYEKFENFLESASNAVKELQEKSSNSTVILFQSLAKKIAEAKLTQPQINEIEHGVCMLVFTKLGKFMSENNLPKI